MKKVIQGFSLLAGFALTLSGCSSTSGSLATGAGVGGMAGAGLGAMADPGPDGGNRFRNVVIGTGAGALLGAGTGYAIDRSNRDATEEGKRQGRKDAEDDWNRKSSASTGGGQPELLAPKTEARWVPDQVKSSTFIPGHFEYQIVSPARWDTKR
jgi:hypothetical protein